MNRKLLSLLLLVGLGAAVAAVAVDHDGAYGRMRERHHMVFAGPLADADANRDGAVDAAEWNALFAKLDGDRDGKLEMEELHAPPPEALAYFLGHGADTDGDGKVTTAEWQARVSALDTDRDGALSPAELSFRMRHRFGDAEEKALALPPFAARWDADEDGKLDSGELAALFAAADEDGDGALFAHHEHGRRR
jgi:hypothetical protein